MASALPLAGFIGGAALGARIGPTLLPEGAESSYAPLVAVLAGILLGAFVAVALDGVSRRFRRRIGSSAVGVADGIGGALRKLVRPRGLPRREARQRLGAYAGMQTADRRASGNGGRANPDGVATCEGGACRSAGTSSIEPFLGRRPPGHPRAR